MSTRTDIEPEHDDVGKGFIVRDRRRGIFDPRITLGNLLTIIGMVVAGLLAWGSMNKDIEILRVRFEIYVQQNEREKALRENVEKIQEQIRQLDKKVETKSSEIKRRIGG